MYTMLKWYRFTQFKLKLLTAFSSYINNKYIENTNVNYYILALWERLKYMRKCYRTVPWTNLRSWREWEIERERERERERTRERDRENERERERER